MLAKSVIAPSRKVLDEDNFALHEPRLTDNRQRYVQNCITATCVSSVGAFVVRFEKVLAAYTGIRRVIDVVNGTIALRVASQLVGLRANDEVIVPALTFAGCRVKGAAVD